MKVDCPRCQRPCIIRKDGLFPKHSHLVSIFRHLPFKSRFVVERVPCPRSETKPETAAE